jgi:hypothetical protein
MMNDFCPEAFTLMPKPVRRPSQIVWRLAEGANLSMTRFVSFWRKLVGNSGDQPMGISRNLVSLHAEIP